MIRILNLILDLIIGSAFGAGLAFVLKRSFAKLFRDPARVPPLHVLLAIILKFGLLLVGAAPIVFAGIHSRHWRVKIGYPAFFIYVLVYECFCLALIIPLLYRRQQLLDSRGPRTDA